MIVDIGSIIVREGSLPQALELSLELLGSLSLIGCGLQICWPAEDQTDPPEHRLLGQRLLGHGLDEESDERDWVAQ